MFRNSLIEKVNGKVIFVVLYGNKYAIITLKSKSYSKNARRYNKVALLKSHCDLLNFKKDICTK